MYSNTPRKISISTWFKSRCDGAEPLLRPKSFKFAAKFSLSTSTCKYRWVTSLKRWTSGGSFESPDSRENLWWQVRRFLFNGWTLHRRSQVVRMPASCESCLELQRLGLEPDPILKVTRCGSQLSVGGSFPSRDELRLQPKLGESYTVVCVTTL